MQITRIALFLVVLLATGTSLFAQAGATGTILGTVTDSSGAVIPGAAVTVTNTATGIEFKTTTSSAGDFQATALLSGPYSVSAEVKGFKKAVTTGLVLAVDQKLRVNFSLVPGEVSTTVQVSGQGVALDTDSTALSQLVSGRQVENLPLNGRNFMQLLLVTPGAVTVGGEQGTMRQGVGNAVSVNGGRPAGNNYTLDGLTNTDESLVTPAVILSQDAIQEFQVQSGTYSAEYGFSVSQINIVSKGGTNQLHGSFFEFNRNDAYDAKPFPTATNYTTGVPTSNPVLRQNQFGFVMHGPVYLPKVYDGHNKTFWMANYEGWRITNGRTLNNMVPNPAMLTGNFADETYAPIPTAGLPGGPLPAYGTAECATLLSLNRSCMPVDPTTGQAFPGNRIPTDRITNNLANVAIKNNYFATPTISNRPQGVPNFVQNIGLPLTSNQQTYRIDQNLGKWGSIFGRGTYAKYSNGSLNTQTLGYGVETVYQTEENWAVSHTVSFGGTSVNNFRFGYLDAQAPQGAPAPTEEAISALGLTGTFTKFKALQQSWPYMNVAGYGLFGGPVNAYTGSDAPAWEFADSFSMIRGKHRIGLGVDYRRWRLIRNLGNDYYGDWTFNANTILSNSTNCSTASGLCGTGNSIADLMLGYFASVQGYAPGPLSPTDEAGNPQTHIFSYFAPYAEDAWKVTQRLTLNLGLRWDFRAAPYEEKNHFFWLDTQNANGGLCYADKTLSTNGVAPGGTPDNPVLRYCGKVPRPGSKTPFAPRVGLNFRLNNKSVIRAGYGIFWDSSEGREIDDSGDIYPYSIRNNIAPPSQPDAAKLGNQMFPSYTTLGSFPLSSLSFIAVIQSEDPLTPYVQSWTGSFERELARNTTLEVNYVGTHSVHLLNRRNIAQPNAIPAEDLAACQANPQDVTHNCPNYLRRPYENFTGVYINSDFHGYAHYNAMNVKLQRSAGDLAATVIYTLAQSKDDKSAAAGVGATTSGWQGFMDNHHPELDYGLSDFNVKNRFVATFIYGLPFGRGQKFLGGINRAADLAIGSWQITGITTFQQGFPFSMSAADASSLLGTFNQRANLSPSCSFGSNHDAKFQRLNMSCFSQPSPGVYGNSARNFMTQPGINNWDLGIGKSFNLVERVKFQFNAQAFNAFNHHQYANAVGGLATAGSGGGSSIDNNIANVNAGKIIGSSPARILQLSGKITF